MMNLANTRCTGRWSQLVAFTLLLSMVLAGCSVLTDSQVNVINNFAQATKGFSASPAAVMEAHATLRAERGVLVASTMTTHKSALKTLEQGMQQEDRLRQEASKATAALSILDTYSDLLNTLSSDRFTDDLKNKSVALGTALDQDVAVLNKLTGGSTQSFGALVAGIVRGGGGILVRHMQQKALYQAVTNAHEAVTQATRAVEKLMAAYSQLDPKKLDLDLFMQEFMEIKQNFPMMQSAASHRWDLQTLDRVQAALRSSERGLALAKSCSDAAAKYREAHAKLVQALKGGSDPSFLIAEINALAQQVKAGKEVRDELKKKVS